MKIFYKLNEENRLEYLTTCGNGDNSIELDDMPKLEKSLAEYTVENGQITYVGFTEKQAILQQQASEEEKLSILRSKRKHECFPVINRGYIWYSTLSTEQIEELKNWYNGWLNVTATLVVPDKPEWLD